jgi:rubrerythrin
VLAEIFTQWTPLALAVGVPLMLLAWLLGRLTDLYRRRKRRRHRLSCRVCGHDLNGRQPINCPKCHAPRPADTPEVVERRRQGLCPACEYDLRGSSGKTCPECGAQRRPVRWEERLHDPGLDET